MTKKFDWLYWLNIVGMVLYLVVFGALTLMGRPYYPGQTQLLGQVAAGLLLVSLPYIIGHFGHFEFPRLLVALYEIFILLSILLGTGMQFYGIPYWDKFEHLFSAAMLAGLGLAIFSALTPKERLPKVNPLLLALFAVAFGTMIGVLWEFYEFTGDGLLGLNMQRYMSGHTLLQGRAALMDTMGDLAMDFLGSLLLAIAAYFGIRRDWHWLDKFMFKKIQKS
ncbi:hypothetical protein [Lacticaseibacillus brantae]|uniref:Uncharacterized protein n=1 Tax=Lacticaseibacillus brantae DSM 23927 TaxID=1423727 RepID=A0A0R2AW96_9LACO|nr:hypothetical protein [Lacticaseibacillus brantae]KRM71255.1 hypothetical protein FC34_GL001733 [Lacticaseibacillus brantae DSM 23927]